MRALVVYESMYGNTRAIAASIAAGLRATHEVTLVPVSRATSELAAAADLIVAGCPTHIHGMPTARSRQAAAENAGKPGSGLNLDPDAAGPGLRAWLDGLTVDNVLAASFDTRLSGIPVFTGRASRNIARLLGGRGGRLLVPPESFLAGKEGALLTGEIARARAWGALIGKTACAAYAAKRP
jgi:hypothetical protein